MLDGDTELWYGTWPPEETTWGANMEEQKTAWQKHSSTVLFFLAFTALGVLLVFVKPYLWDVARPIADSIAVALFTAAAIGLTADLYFRKQLASDVFEATLGYLLPKELRPQMRWIYKHQLICTSDQFRFDLSPVKEEHIRVHVTRIQTLENKGSDKAKLTPALGIDEWFVKDYPSRLIDFTCTLGSKRWSINEGQPKKNECGLAIQSKEFEIPPGEQMYIKSEFEEFRHMNDAFLYRYKYPTLKTEVTVKAFEAIGKRTRFATKDDPQPMAIGGDTDVLNAVTLPYQYVQVRWWRKTDAEEWMRKIS